MPTSPCRVTVAVSSPSPVLHCHRPASRCCRHHVVIVATPVTIMSRRRPLSSSSSFQPPMLTLRTFLLLAFVVFELTCNPVAATQRLHVASGASPFAVAHLVLRQNNNIQRCPLLFLMHPPNDASLPLPSQSSTPSPVALPTLPDTTSTSRTNVTCSPASDSDSNSLPSFSPLPLLFTTASRPLLPLLRTASVRADDDDYDDDNTAVAPRVVGGASVSFELLPYIAVLWFTIDGNTGVCSATLVSPTLLITAAHCVLVENMSDLRIYLGASRGNPPDGTFRTASSIEPHPFFSNGNANSAPYDIAYIRLSSPAPASSRFMRVNTNASVPLLGSVVRNIGYGLFDPSDLDSNVRFVPHQIDLPVTGGTFCRRQWKPFRIFIDRQRQVCAGYLKGGCGSCNGDSGGPIFQYDELDRPVLIGVASIAVECSTTEVPTVYVRVSAFIGPFIPDDGVTLTNHTVAYVLPEANRTYPNGEGPASLSSSGGVFQLDTSTWVLIGVGVLCVAFVLAGFLKWGALRRRPRPPSQLQQHQQPQALNQPQHPVHLGPVLVPLQPMVPPRHGVQTGEGGNFVTPDQIINPIQPPPPAVLHLNAANSRQDGNGPGGLGPGAQRPGE